MKPHGSGRDDGFLGFLDRFSELVVVGKVF